MDGFLTGNPAAGPASGSDSTSNMRTSPSESFSACIAPMNSRSTCRATPPVSEPALSKKSIACKDWGIPVGKAAHRFSATSTRNQVILLDSIACNPIFINSKKKTGIQSGERTRFEAVAASVF